MENNCSPFYQIRLVYTPKSYIHCTNFPKMGLICQNWVFSQTFTPTCQYLYTDISVISVTFRNSDFRLITRNPFSLYCVETVLPMQMCNANVLTFHDILTFVANFVVTIYALFPPQTVSSPGFPSRDKPQDSYPRIKRSPVSRLVFQGDSANDLHKQI